MDRCAHTDLGVVTQRSSDDCMACVLAMFAGRSYEEVTVAARQAQPGYSAGKMMSHALLRRIAHGWGLVLLSSIYMDWRYPGIVGVVSLVLENTGHALFWDGTRLIDPSGSGLYDLDYVRREALEFTQRASDLAALIELERSMQPATEACAAAEYF